MTTDTTRTPPAATSAPQDDEYALRVLLRRRVALYPALRRDDCPPGTFAAYLEISGAILHLQVRVGLPRFREIKAEVAREAAAAPPRAVAAPGEEASG